MYFVSEDTVKGARDATSVLGGVSSPRSTGAGAFRASSEQAVLPSEPAAPWAGARSERNQPLPPGGCPRLGSPSSRDRERLCPEDSAVGREHSLLGGLGPLLALAWLRPELTVPAPGPVGRAVTLVLVPLCSSNSSKVVPRFERFGLGVLESSNPKM